MLPDPERRVRRRILVAGAVLVAVGTAPGRSAARTEPPSAVQVRSIEIAAVGDMTFGRTGFMPAGGARAILGAVSRRLRSDLTVGNLETTLGSGGAPKCLARSTTCYSFEAPADTAAALRHVGFTAVKRVRRAARRADLVVVFIHAGAEGNDRQHVRPGMETYLGERRGDPIRFSHAVVDAGADVVLGSGPHVLRAMEWYRGRLIAYSLGNFTAYHTLAIDGISGVSAILRLRLSADGSFVGGRLVPIRLTGSGSPSADPSRTAIGIVNALSRSDFPVRGLHIDRHGVLRTPRGASAGK